MEQRYATKYETIYILKPELEDPERENIGERIKSIITQNKGKVLEITEWGKKKLAYKIKKESKGIYVYLKYVGYRDIVEKIHHTLKVIEPVLKYQTVRLEKGIEIEKLKIEEIRYTKIEPKEKVKEEEEKKEKSFEEVISDLDSGWE